MEDVMRKTARLNTAVRSALTMIIELGIVTQERIFRSCPRDQSQWFLQGWKNAGGCTMGPSRRVRRACIAPGVVGDMKVKHCLLKSTRTPLIGFELTGCSLTIHPSEISEVQEFSTAKPERIGTSPKIPFFLANHGTKACMSIHRFLGHRGHVSRWIFATITKQNLLSQ